MPNPMAATNKVPTIRAAADTRKIDSTHDRLNFMAKSGNGSGRTLVEDIYRKLRNDICLGRLMPGSRLNLREFSNEQEVSLTVVREAVTRLASERLMESTPQQGFRVRPLSAPDLLDLTRVRIELERLTLRDSIERGDLAWEAELLAAHHRLAGVIYPEPPKPPSDPWLDAHSKFHAALAAACSSPLLKQLRQQYFDAAELYRYWSRAAEPPKHRRSVDKEHKALLDAALTHDANAVVEQCVEHIERTTAVLLLANPT